MNKNRCKWVTDDPLYMQYHDEEWGRLDRFRDDRYLFEMLILEGAQAGLSWLTILKRRENYLRAFDHFDVELVAAYDEEKKATLLADAGIIRNARKIDSAIRNARAFLRLQAEFGSFHHFLWEFFGEKQRINHWESISDVPAATLESEHFSKELKKRGFSFVGPVICYSFMQAVGLVDDHMNDCFIRNEKCQVGASTTKI